MATKTELQQALALKKENPKLSTRDAVMQVRQSAPVQNAPVAGQPPPITNPVGQTTTPTTSVHDNVNLGNSTESINQAQRQENIAKRQGMIAQGQIPQVGTQATPEQVPQIVQQVEAQKVTPSVTTETPTATPTTTTPPPKTEKKAEIVTPERPATVGDMFNNIVNRIDVTPEQKALPSYKIAQNRYTKASMYASMTPAQLAQDVKDAKIVEGSPAWEDIKMLNPKLVRDTQNLNTVNGTKPTIFTYVNNPDGTRTKENKLESSFVSDYEDNYGDIVAVLKGIYGGNTAQEARDAIYTPDVRQAEAKATEIELQMNAIDDQIQAVDADVEKEFEGSGATGSRIALEKAYRKEKLGNQYNSLLKNYTTYANKANNLITQNTDLYKSQQEQKKAMQNALAGLAMTQYQSQLGLQKKQAEMQMEADFEKRQAYENLNDPATAIANVMAEYKILGIPFTTTIQSRLQEFANSGLSLPDYLTQMTESIQSSPAYKQYAQMKAGELSDVQKMQLQAQISERADIRNFAQQIQLAQMQGDITRANYLWQMQNDPEKQAKLLELQQKANENKSLYDMLGVNVGTYEGNRGYDLAGKKGDPVPAGGNWKVKSVIDANHTSSPYGNSVVMEDENGNTVRYSHLESIGVKPGDTLKFGDIVGTRGNTGNVRGKNGEVLTAEQIKAGRGSHVDVEIKDKSGRLLSQAEQVDYLKSKTPNQGALSQIGQFMKDNQQRGPGYSEEDVRAFNEKIDRFVKSGDEKGIALAFRTNLFQDKDFKQEFDNTKKFTTALDQVQTLINEYENSGKSTNALKGMAEKIARKIGLTTDQALAQLQTQMGFTLANYIKSISGTAASDVEVQRLMGNMANISNVKDLNTTIISQVKDNADSSLKSMIDTRMYGMPENLKYIVFSDVYTQASPSTSKYE